MTQDPTDPHHPYDPHPDRSKTKVTASYADQDFIEADEMDEAGRPTDEEIESNELHIPEGHVCAHCGQPLAATSEVRKTVSGEYVHEMCPPRFART